MRSTLDGRSRKSLDAAETLDKQGKRLTALVAAYDLAAPRCDEAPLQLPGPIQGPCHRRLAGGRSLRARVPGTGQNTQGSGSENEKAKAETAVVLLWVICWYARISHLPCSMS